MKDKNRVAIIILHRAKSLICHTVFFWKFDLYCTAPVLGIDVLSAGGFQKQGPLGYVYLLCCQLVGADTD